MMHSSSPPSALHSCKSFPNSPLLHNHNSNISSRQCSLLHFRCHAVQTSQQQQLQLERTKSNNYCDDTLASYGRRTLLFTLLAPLMLWQHHIAEASDAGGILVIQQSIRKILTKAKAAGILRLVFHDAGTFDMDDNSGGMNGSIIYELDRPENAGLSKSVKVLDKAKTEIDKVMPVSWADLIAVAGAEAVAFCGGPNIPVQIGRLDARLPDPEGRLPEETLNASALKNCFRKKGFSTQELVALSGAHTIGNKGFGNPFSFDNSYYQILLKKPWTSSDGMASMIGLPSDRALVEDEECLRWIRVYADDQARFFDDFKLAYNKLVNSGASWKSA